MKDLTIEWYNRLMPLEKHFHSVVFSNYKKASMKGENELMAEAYFYITGNKVACKSCAKTIFNAFKIVANKYYQFQSRLSNVTENETVKEEQPQINNKPQPKKRGRKPKQ